MKPYHNSVKQMKSLQLESSQSLRNAEESYLKFYETLNKTFLEKIEKHQKQKQKISDSIETLLINIEETREKNILIKDCLDLEKEKEKRISSALKDSSNYLFEDSALHSKKQEILEKTSNFSKILKKFEESLSMKIESIQGGVKFTFWSLSKANPLQEFWVEVLSVNSEMAVGNLSHPLNISDSIDLLTKQRNLVKFLKEVRVLFKRLA